MRLRILRLSPSPTHTAYNLVTCLLLTIHFPLSTECQTPELRAVSTLSVTTMDPTSQKTTFHEQNPSSSTGAKHASTLLDVYDHSLTQKKFQLPPFYSKDMRPSKFGESVLVEFDIHVQAINPIKAADMDFRMEVLLSLRWVDARLNFSDDVFYDSEHLHLPSEFIDLIWHPDPYIANAKQTDIGQLTGRLVNVYIYRNHTVAYSANLFVTVACAMQFQYYPYDFQLCPMVIESFSYDETKVKYAWSKYQKFTINPKLRLLQFVVTYPLVAEECTIHRINEDHNVSQLIAYFRFDRLLGNHLIQTFAPCSLVTALSWLSFWFELDAISARVSLLVTSMLTLVTQFSGLKADFPPVAYVKAVDIWMAGCMLFVFSALGEFVIVKVIYTKTEVLRRHLMNGGGGSEDDTTTDEDSSRSGTGTMRSCTPLVTPSGMNNGSGNRVGSGSPPGNLSKIIKPAPATTPAPPLIKSYSMQTHRLGSVMIDGKHSRIHSSLDIRAPFCCGIAAVPLIWTDTKTKTTRILWKEIDAFSRWIFPFTFGLFLTIYWLVLFVHSSIHAPATHYGTC